MVLRGVSKRDIVIAEPSGILRPKPGDVVLYRKSKSELRLGEYIGGGVISHVTVAQIASVDSRKHPPVAVCLEVRRSLRSAPVSPQLKPQKP